MVSGQMVPEIGIRRAEAKDSGALARIFVESRLETFYWQNPARFRLEDFEKETAGETVFVAEDGSGKILGFISVWEPERFVHHLYIALPPPRVHLGTAHNAGLRRALLQQEAFPRGRPGSRAPAEDPRRAREQIG